MLDWPKEFQDVGALWMYDGEHRASQPHCLLTSGKHSGGFFNGTKVMQNPKLAQVACADLVSGIGHDNWKKAQWIIGPAQGAITMAYQLAANMECLAGFTEKDNTSEAMVLRRFSINPGDHVVVCEDVTTTGGTTLKNIEALEQAGAKVLPVIATLVNRSGMHELNGRRIIALIERELPMYSADSCPYCQVGSKPLRPKSHWAELTGQKV